MTIKRLTRDDIRNATGTFNPVGHAVLAFADDTTTAQAVAALRAAGFGENDIIEYTGAAVAPRLREMVGTSSQSAGFGYEITLMRRYLALAEAGCGWLVVYAPDDAATQRVTDVATRFAAKSAVKYNRLLNEELI